MIRPRPFNERETSITPKENYLVGEFFAMGCPCQLLMETSDIGLAEQLLLKVRDETWRLEALWSRYLASSIVERINRQPNVSIDVDSETAALLNYCDQLWQLSEGAFDITSGVLRKIWSFSGGAKIPNTEQVRHVLTMVGWHKVHWQSPTLKMQTDMQIDFGGVGKEYAVDLCCRRLIQATDISCLVNFGGDCAVTQIPKTQRGWNVGIESVDQLGQAVQSIELKTGAIATSGNSHRFVQHEGKLLSHIMDARTGWPVAEAPSSITVQAKTCLEAGMFATLACLQGKNAKGFLEKEGLTHWVQQ